MKSIQFPAQLQKIATRVDGSINISLDTQELNGTDMAELFSYRNALGYVTFTPNAVVEVSVPDQPASDNTKSPSQRLRATLFIMWSQSNKKIDTFEMYYKVQMERIINQIKDKLE